MKCTRSRLGVTDLDFYLRYSDSTVLIITACVHSTMGGYVLTGVCLFSGRETHTRTGVPLPPLPPLVRMGVPLPALPPPFPASQDRGFPSLPGPGEGYPPLPRSQDRGTPPLTPPARTRTVVRHERYASCVHAFELSC